NETVAWRSATSSHSETVEKQSTEMSLYAASMLFTKQSRDSTRSSMNATVSASPGGKTVDTRATSSQSPFPSSWSGSIRGAPWVEVNESFKSMGTGPVCIVFPLATRWLPLRKISLQVANSTQLDR